MPPNQTTEGLKRVIGIPALALSIINGVIGAGIFALPGTVTESLGPYSLLAYLFCSIMLAALMLCYAEIGSRVNSSGGSYTYVLTAFGELPGYIVNWLYFFGWSVLGSAALMNILADSLSVIFPYLKGYYPRSVLILLLCLFMVMINRRGAKQGINLVKAISIIKLLPLAAIIIFGLSLVKASNFQPGPVPPLKVFGDTILILFFAFAGFETSLGASGEIIAPRRTVPRALLIGGGTILLFYILLQIVVQGSIGKEIAQFKLAPLAAVAEKIIGPVGATVLLIAAAISCFGGVTADILATPRSLFALANHGMFPKFLGKVHPRFATPHLAISTYGLLIFVFSISGGFKQLAMLASAAILLVYLAVVLAMMKLRKKPGEGNFRAPGGWVTPIIAIAAIIWLLSSLSLMELLATFIFIAAVCLLYFTVKWARLRTVTQK